MEPLDDKELKQLLRQWDAPDAPPGLQARVLPRKSWWQWLLRGSIRVPVPIGIAAVVILALWMLAGRRAPTPVVQPASSITLADFQPVRQLEPKIIGTRNEREDNAERK